MTQSKFIKHISCPKCGSSDANSLYDDGHTYCFKCEKTTQASAQDAALSETLGIRPVAEVFRGIKDRGITEATCKYFGVLATDERHYYPYFDEDGTHVSNKIRFVAKKEFSVEGPLSRGTLFGQNRFPAGSQKAITICEGELDAMAAYQMSGSRYAFVSLRNGVSGVAKDIADNFEYLNSFPTVVICFDKDEGKINAATGEVRYPGQEAAQKAAGMFPIGKVKILTLREYKDACDYLVHGKAKEYVEEWWKAPIYTPTGLKLGRDMWDEITKPKNYETVNYPWDSLNHLTYGIRLSELVVLTADTGIGKTSILKEIEYHVLKNTDRGVGFLHLEEPNSDTALGLMSIDASIPLHLPDYRAEVSDERLRDYFDSVVNSDRVVIWDHFGSNSIDEVLAKVRHMHNLGCKYIVLDHLSIVVSDQSGDERKQLDEIATRLKTLCMELNIAVLAVIHTNRQGLIRGTAGVEQLANIVIHAYRNKTDNDPFNRNVTKLVVEKNRFCGKTGPGCWLYYNPETGRLRELDQGESQNYENGVANGEAW